MTHMYIGYPVDISIYTYTLSRTCVYRKCLYMYTIYIYIQTHVPCPYVYSYTHNPAIHTLYPHLNPTNTYVHSYTIIFISLPILSRTQNNLVPVPLYLFGNPIKPTTI